MFATKHAVACDFGGASSSYEDAARLQRQMGDVILAGAPAPGYRPATVVDLGCGTGWYTRQLAQCYGAHAVIGVDLAPGMLAFARSRSPAAIRWLQADAEQLPLTDQSVDLIFSNLMIQWCRSPQDVLRECLRVLRPGGQLMISTLLRGTLCELQQAWALADPRQNHVNRFLSATDFAASVEDVLLSAQLRSEVISLDYSSPMALMAELKQLGAGYKDTRRRKTVTAPGRVRHMCQNYPRQPDGSIIASYHASWLQWRKPLLTALICNE